MSVIPANGKTEAQGLLQAKVRPYLKKKKTQTKKLKEERDGGEAQAPA
jgi:hypothetical protein